MPYLRTAFGNPSSAHRIGLEAAGAVRRARHQLIGLIGARFDSELVFTSGATEANDLAIRGAAHAVRGRGNHVVTTAIEHKAVLAACRALVTDGYRLTVVPVGSDGTVDPRDIADAITDDTVLVSVMHANNEIGTVQPLAEIGRITRARGVLFHTDAAQSLSLLPFDVNETQVDLASFSAHKFYGPKGVGALYIRRGSGRLSPRILGGDQEFGLRSGTLNVPGIVGAGYAASILESERADEARRIGTLRDRLLVELLRELPHARLNGSRSRRLPSNISLTVPHLDANYLVSDLRRLAISTGSACNTGTRATSHVLEAIGVEPSALRSTLRISVGRQTTVDDVDFAVRELSAHISTGVPAT
jgi:cysteine desulfurase